MRKMIATLISLWFLTGACSFGQRKGESTYAEATFEYSTDPNRVILHIVEGRQDLKIQSMTVFGDGRLDLEIRSGPDNVLAEHSRQLSSEEMDRILGDVVENGLAEWDNGRIHSLQLTKRGGRPYAPPPDSRNVTILISLSEYRRGPYEVKNLERTVHVRGAEYATKVFPDILEFRGVVRLIAHMDEEFDRLGGG